MRLAVWSGPRNLSTALMYAFANRVDFSAVDEPFYAAYLKLSGLKHPMVKEILASQAQDPAEVVKALLAPIGAPHRHMYHKHMTQHMIPEIPRDWMREVENVFLIRHPMRVVASFARKYENPTLADQGFLQQESLFEGLRAQGQTPLVIDSADILFNPERALRRLCAALELGFDPAMLSWPAGGMSCDGVWAAHWYGAVHRSTGFSAAEAEPLPDLPDHLKALADQAMPAYDTLAQFCLRP